MDDHVESGTATDRRAGIRVKLNEVVLVNADGQRVPKDERIPQGGASAGRLVPLQDLSTPFQTKCDAVDMEVAEGRARAVE